MVREFGLSKEIGPIGYPEGGSVFLGGGGPGLSSRPYAEQTQARIDAEVQALLVQAEHRAVELLTNNRTKLRQLVELLVAQETVDGAQVYAIAGVAEPSRTDGGTTVAPQRAAVTTAALEEGSSAPAAIGVP
jgi:cell division protease FtsH